MNGDKKIAARSLRRPVSQTGNIAGKINLAHPDGALAQGPGQHLGKHPVKGELAPPTGADRPAILQTVAHIDRDQRRRGECCGRQRNQGKNQHVQESHAQIIAAI